MNAVFRILIISLLSILTAFVAACGSGDDDDDSGSGDLDDTAGDDDAGDDDAGDDDADDDTGPDDDTDDDTSADDTSTDDTSDDDDTTVPVSIAFIYNTDDTAGLAFQTFLVDNGYVVDLYSYAELGAKTAPDFSGTDMFMVDETVDQTVWEEPEANLVVGTGKPIFGLGRGMYVLMYTTTYFGGQHGAGGIATTDMTPLSTSHTVWHSPNDLGTLSGDLQILSSSDVSTELNDNGSSPAGVEFLGEHPADPGYYLMAFETVKYAFWGFFATDPATYTADGKMLLLNAIEYALSGAKF
jgi:hypothetical protein